VRCARILLVALAGALCAASCAPETGERAGDGAAPAPAGDAPVGPADEPAPAQLAVTVRAAEDGTVVAGAAVTAAGPSAARTARTDAAGAARFELAPGEYTVALDPPVAEPAQVRLAHGAAHEHAFRVETRATHALELRIVAAEDEHPLAGATVRVDGVPDWVRDAVAQAAADADGIARVRVPAWCASVASIAAPGRGEARIALPRAEPPGDPTRPVPAVRLARLGELRGRLTNGAGAPLAGVEIVARVAAAELFLADAAPRDAAAIDIPGDDALVIAGAATTAADGAFALALPPYVGVMLEAEAGEGAERRHRALGVVRLAPAESVERELVLESGTRVDGTLLGPGDAARAGVLLWLVRGGARGAFTRFEEIEDRAVTDAEGRFAFLGVEPGSWRIGPAPVSTASEPVALSAAPALLEVLPGMPRAEVVVRLPAALHVRGRTVDAHRAPVGGIELIALGGGQSRAAVSGADGAFRIGPFAAGAPGEIVLRTAAGPGFVPSAPVSVRAGDDDVEIRVVRTGALRGAVTRDGGAPSAGLEVRLERNEGARAAGALDLAPGADGELLLADAEPGSYVVIARAEPDLVAAQAVEIAPAGTAEVALELEAGARARCRLDAAHAALFYVVFAGALPVERGRVDARTELVTRAVPAGEITVELRGPSGLIERRTATAPPGQTAILDFQR
jgi:hypothetical protein